MEFKDKANSYISFLLVLHVIRCGTPDGLPIIKIRGNR
jgi:hypothetical protein